MTSGSLERTEVGQLAEFVAATDIGTLPDSVARSCRQRILDILGLAAAAVELETSQAATRVTLARGGACQASAVGVSQQLPAVAAAFVNGVLAHSLDYDDTHLPSVLHPSASVVPASLATAERTSADGEELLAAVAAGLEVCIRLGMAGYDRAGGNSTFFEHGQHATSICGAIASAAAAARLCGLDSAGIAHAMGIAVSMASGVLEGNRTGGTVKRLHCGWAAQTGVSAAELAAAGITGPPTVLEGRFGFFQAFLGGEYRPEELSAGLGESWSIPEIFFKPYPANHFTHAAIDAALQLRSEGVLPEMIEALHLAVASSTVRTIGEPIETKRAPQTGYEAQFSGPYTVVAALFGGGGLGLSFEDFTDELAAEPRRRALMARVEVGSDPRCDKLFPWQFPAILTARLTDGSERIVEVLTNRGGPDNPLDDAELATKFRSNATRLVDLTSAKIVAERCARLGAGGSVSDIVRPLISPGSRAR